MEDTINIFLMGSLQIQVKKKTLHAYTETKMHVWPLDFYYSSVQFRTCTELQRFCVQYEASKPFFFIAESKKEKNLTNLICIEKQMRTN